jgi:Heterokaryon incompatibility protein (HET)
MERSRPSLERKVHYDPLQHASSFRLIELLPGEYGDELHCRVYEADLDHPPAYEAISYVWGSEADKVAITCNGADFGITQELAAALQRFRKSDASRTLWVDSICIIQEDVLERNQQVKVMDRIYRIASCVLIWLGEGEEADMEATCSGIVLMARLWSRSKELKQWRQIGLLETDPNQTPAEVTMHFNIPSADSITFAALGRLWRGPWFYRVWTFQESFLAKQRLFYFGSHKVWGIVMACAISSLSALYDATSDERFLSSDRFHVDSMVWYRVSSRWGESPSPVYTAFFGIISVRRGSGCKDPSDQVYSLLGAATDRPSLEPDYLKPFGCVFAESVLSMIEGSSSLDVFREATEVSEESDLPSWVPDWRVKGSLSRPFSSLTSNRSYSCTGSSRPLTKLSSDSKEVTLQGLYLDRIVAVADVHPLRQKEWVRQHLMNTDNFEPCHNFTDASLDDNLLRIICVDRTLFDEESLESRWTSTSHEQVKSLHTDVCQGLRKEAYIKFLEQISGTVKNKKLMVTRGQRLGLVPSRAKAGDVIALLLGGEVPIVLRPKGDKYTLVGECFVDGVMDGEGLVEARKQARPDADHDDTSCSVAFMKNRFHSKHRISSSFSV